MPCSISSILMTLALLAPTSLALAEGSPVSSCVVIIRGDNPATAQLVNQEVSLQTPHTQAPYVVVRQVQQTVVRADSPAVIQVVNPSTVELHNRITVYLDPRANYQNNAAGRLDPNDNLLRAQALWRNVNGNRAQIIRGANPSPEAQPPETPPVTAGTPLPQPRFIIEKPVLESTPNNPGDPMPNVPRPPAVAAPQLVQAPNPTTTVN